MGTDLAAAIGAAAGAVPPGYAPRVVLISDGNATSGDVLAAAREAAVPVWTVPLPPRSAREVQVSEVIVPAEVREGEPFQAQVIVSANHPDEGFLDVFDNNGRISLPSGSLVRLRPGENVVSFTYRLVDQRVAQIKATIHGFQADELKDDNSAVGVVRCKGKPRVLLLDGDAGEARHLIDALTQEGIQVDPPRLPDGMPETIAELQNFDLVILSNVPASHPKLTRRQLEQLRSYVQDFCGGLLIIGGDHSFGPGGYAKSPLEEILPVYCDFRKEQEKPSLAMVFVLDKSGSMAGEKIDLVKDATRGAVELLAPKDSVGIVTFDTAPRWTCTLRACSQMGQILSTLDLFDAEGGTSIYPGLERAFLALSASGTTARYKHVILLSDGVDGEQSKDFDLLLNKMQNRLVTVSCVAVGRDADVGLLQHIAKRGGGRYYSAVDLGAVPQIFAQETIQATKDALIEEPFRPMLFRRSPVLAGLDLQQAPDLNGYVVTRAKPTCEQILVTHHGDPLLVWWRNGLGMCGAFTSDAQTRWAEPWISNWEGGFSKFWAQVVRHLMRKQEAAGTEVRIERKGTRATVFVDAIDDDGAFRNDVPTTLSARDPSDTPQLIPMRQSAPGRYEAEFDAKIQGQYDLVITQSPPDGKETHLNRGLSVGYPDELRLRPPDEAALRELAEATGGRYNPDADAVFEPATSPVNRDTPLWPYLVAAAAFLFVADVAVRRLDVTGFAGNRHATPRAELSARGPSSINRTIPSSDSVTEAYQGAGSSRGFEGGNHA
jgi:uncharacterized membrane protein/uncharacterized protein YegL